jgi:chemotaxis protein MotB
VYSLGRTGTRRAINIWPGFVDALATLLLVVIFVLMVFMIAQFFLSVALSGKNDALVRLNTEVQELADLLALERSANIELNANIGELSSQLQESVTAQDNLANQLRALIIERDDLAVALSRAEAEALQAQRESSEAQSALAEIRGAESAALSELEAERQKLEQALARMRIDEEKLRQAQAFVASKETELEAAYKTIEADKETIEAQLAELAILQSLRDEMRKEVLAGEAALVEQESLTDEATAQVALLNRQIAALREQLASLSVALDVMEAENEEKEVQIADLGRRLNAALATKVQELARFRSDFFGRLRELLGDRQDIRVVGDRFVFQSEVLFASGSAELEPEGRKQLSQLASALAEIAATIPEDIDWVLRVDGHTDRRPISTPEFPSNWELSTARAISVVKFLIIRGIGPNRLAATGFGQFQPLDTGSDEIAFRRNRRIELKLTQR